MNCKPGDLAVIFRSDGHGLGKAVGDACIGHHVVVTRLRPPLGEGNCTTGLVWHIERPVVVSVGGEEFSVIGVEDHCLRPIRDPGEHAVDEMLRPLPAEPVRA
jgi:hypothetical protein